MACEVCEHCQEPIISNHNSIIHAGRSYHKDCHKCYVCSETDLKGAEIFKGVIFCSSCSKRIFQGCSSARRNKDLARSKPTRSRSRSRPKRRDRTRQRIRKSELPQPKTIDVLELARFTHSFDSDSGKKMDAEPNKISIKSSISAELEELKHNIKRDSAEIGMMTDVTLQLLKEMNCPVIEWPAHIEEKPRSLKHYYITERNKDNQGDQIKFCRQKPKEEERKEKSHKKPPYSDIRMAELGASTEIATMTLRNQSDFPVTRKAPSHNVHQDSLNISLSDESIKILEKWLESSEALRESSSIVFDKKKISTWFKFPYKYFKRNILQRSSMISVLMSTINDKQGLFSKIKAYFHEEIAQHHRRGTKKLYSTINRRNRYKLGWMPLPVTGIGVKSVRRCKRCKHFRNSHSYRCLRAHTMKHAGPTKSELSKLRGKITNIIMPQGLKRTIIGRKRPTKSEACGDSEAASRNSPTICFKNNRLFSTFS